MGLILLALVFVQANILFAADQQSHHLANNAELEPTVTQNIESMDKDHDGMITVFEVRAFMEARHGKGYQSQVLDDMESSAAGKSCSSPFSKPLY